MELDDEGAGLVAAACNILQGNASTGMTPEQCKFVNADFLTTFWVVRHVRQELSCLIASWSRRIACGVLVEPSLQNDRRHLHEFNTFPAYDGQCMRDVRYTNIKMLPVPWPHMPSAAKCMCAEPCTGAVLYSVCVMCPDSRCPDSRSASRASQGCNKTCYKLLDMGASEVGSPVDAHLRKLIISAMRVAGICQVLLDAASVLCSRHMRQTCVHAQLGALDRLANVW